jgi:phospholipid/cholesterol/gamma-HCH transport system substrate-binding protein
LASPYTTPRNRPHSPRRGEAGSVLARTLTILGVIAAAVVVGLLLFGGSSGYTVIAEFKNASQLVKGNEVEIGGRPVGSVQKISLDQNGLAAVKMSVSGDFAPLHEGTTATIRVNSLSGIANRYVSLQPGPDTGADPIASGSTIPVDETTSSVDLDQIFNTLDPSTRKGLQQLIRGSATQLKAKGKLANQSLHYLAPALSTSSLVAQELTRDQAEFQRFVIDTSNVVTTIAARRDDLSALVSNANATTRAIGDENASLSQALGVLPDTLRQANTTFVDLNSTLDDLDRLVNASKPATKRLAPFFRQLRPLVRDATPTITDLRHLIRTPGPGNDLIELLLKQPRLSSLAKSAFPRTIQALKKGQPVVEYFRPYAPDFTGWLTKFAEGAATYDANGHYARIQPVFNAFTLTDNAEGSFLTAAPPSERLAGLQSHRQERCPGGAVQPPPDGSAPYQEPQTTCDPTTVPPGP